MNILTLANDEQRVSTLYISEDTNTQHKTVIQLVRRYREQLERFGLVTFEMRPRLEGQHGGGETEYALLTEDQSYFLLACMRNNDRVIQCKSNLVAAFAEYRNMVKELQRSQIALPPALEVSLQKMLDSVDRLASMGSETKAEVHVLNNDVKRVESKVDVVESKVNGFEEKLNNVVHQLTPRRRNVSIKDQRKYSSVVRKKYGGKCPCCMDVEIVDAYGRPIKGVHEIDHFYDRSKNKLDEAWAVCSGCNRVGLEQERQSRKPMFDAFQAHLKLMFSEQKAEQLVFDLDDQEEGK